MDEVRGWLGPTFGPALTGLFLFASGPSAGERTRRLVTAMMPQVRYSREDVRRMLVEYQQRFALGARPPKREERIGSQRQRSDEAPWVMTAAGEADLETALRSAPFRWVQIAFMDLAMGSSSWRASVRSKTWREHVGDWWGLTAGEVAAVTAEVIEIAHARLNGHDLPPVEWLH